MWVSCQPIFFHWKIEQWVTSVEEWWLTPVKFNSLTSLTLHLSRFEDILSKVLDKIKFTSNVVVIDKTDAFRVFQRNLVSSFFFPLALNSWKWSKTTEMKVWLLGWLKPWNRSQWYCIGHGIKELISYGLTFPGKELWDNVITQAHTRSLYLWTVESKFSINRPVSHDRNSSSI